MTEQTRATRLRPRFSIGAVGGARPLMDIPGSMTTHWGQRTVGAVAHRTTQAKRGRSAGDKKSPLRR
jgi:hypothetical protein